MTSTRSILIVAVLAVAVAGAAGTAIAMGHNDASPGNETITVSGSGDVAMSPDAAVVRLTVTATANDASNASGDVATDAARLRETLSEFGLADENVQSVGYNVHSQHRGEQERNERYVARQSFEVTLDDIDRTGAVIDAAVDGGADEVTGVRFTLSDSARDEARDQALRNAVDNARGEAQVLAEATDLDLSSVNSVSATNTQVRPYRLEAAAVASDGGAGTEIDTEDVTVTANVQVVYTADA